MNKQEIKLLDETSPNNHDAQRKVGWGNEAFLIFLPSVCTKYH
jgi:hypothetical protein